MLMSFCAWLASLILCAGGAGTCLIYFFTVNSLKNKTAFFLGLIYFSIAVYGLLFTGVDV